jgi:hypothetical protein
MVAVIDALKVIKSVAEGGDPLKQMLLPCQ